MLNTIYKEIQNGTIQLTERKIDAIVQAGGDRIYLSTLLTKQLNVKEYLAQRSITSDMIGNKPRTNKASGVGTRIGDGTSHKINSSKNFVEGSELTEKKVCKEKVIKEEKETVPTYVASVNKETNEVIIKETVLGNKVIIMKKLKNAIRVDNQKIIDRVQERYNISDEELEQLLDECTNEVVMWG